MEKVILSLTTIPQRLNYHNPSGGIKPVIDKLLNLSYGNYEIHLNIPYVNKKNQSNYVIPEWLMEINNTKLKIFRTDDYGSITKLLPTIMRLDENSEQIIITVDDDLEYMDGFIEYHLVLVLSST